MSHTTPRLIDVDRTAVKRCKALLLHCVDDHPPLRRDPRPASVG